MKELSPDVVIMDVSMPNLNGADATRLILRDNPGIRVIALSMHTEKHIVRNILQAGATAYVLKSYIFDELSKALEAAAGAFYLSPRIAGVVLEDYFLQGRGETETEHVDLTVRDLAQVLALVEVGAVGPGELPGVVEGRLQLTGLRVGHLVPEGRQQALRLLVR